MIQNGKTQIITHKKINSFTVFAVGIQSTGKDYHNENEN